MKTNLLFLLFTVFSFAQNHNFDYKNKTIVWKTEISTDLSIKEFLSNSFKIEFKTDNSGVINKTNCDCKGGSFFMKKEYYAEFKIEASGNNYSILVYNFKIHEDMGLFINGVSYNPENTPLESLVIDKSKQIIKTSKQNQKNLHCLNACLTELFNPKDL